MSKRSPRSPAAAARVRARARRGDPAVPRRRSRSRATPARARRRARRGGARGPHARRSRGGGSRGGRAGARDGREPGGGGRLPRRRCLPRRATEAVAARARGARRERGGARRARSQQARGAAVPAVPGRDGAGDPSLSDVAEWPVLRRAARVRLALGAMSFVNWRVRRVPIVMFAIVQLGFVVLLTRLASPFVLTPMMISGVILAQTAVPWAAARRWVVAVSAVLGSALPLVLEHLGVLGSTWSMGEDRPRHARHDRAAARVARRGDLRRRQHHRDHARARDVRVRLRARPPRRAARDPRSRLAAPAAAAARPEQVGVC